MLHCQGTKEEKMRVFYDVLQDALQHQISANDKDFTEAL